MDILFYSATLSLILFMILATYDGFYLHIWKYSLFNKSESKFEHKTHTVRAILFPLIVWFLFVEQSNYTAFLIGLSLVCIDLIVLAIDAYSEKDSRAFMGGLPQWEYIIHLFANGFHFAAIMLLIAVRLDIHEGQLLFSNIIYQSTASQWFEFVALNTIPGAIILAVLHIILMLNRPQTLWSHYRSKVTCC
mgnify:CR=1 FL=1